MKFSQRIGKTPFKIDFQIESMDDDLRNSLWNAIKLFYFDKVQFNNISDSEYDYFFNIVWLHFFKWPLDTLDDYFNTTYKKILELFFIWKWYEVYDFIEFICKIECPTNTEKFIKFCNQMLERELAGYRIISEKITPITNKNEISEIETALEKSKETKLAGVNKHLKEALDKLSDRKSPDYRNSIKESISAVESICRIIAKNKKATLGDALKKIESSIELHPALKKGFSAIYGYTSDADGIRHSMQEKANIDFADAKYMLVSCSAFINYLIDKSRRAGIKF